tara:strand:+ start:229 stop:675 length:447 start_codon:yes stop_codon:yes gene_type:complete
MSSATSSLLLLLVSSTSALQLGAQPQLRLASRARPPVMQFNPFKREAKASNADDAIAFKDPRTLTDEEERKLKLEVGTNWKPRTSTKAGEGYQFFQGPTPKTGVQEDLPDFFSGENFAGAGELGLAPKLVFVLGAASLAAVVAVVLSS